MLFRSYEEGKVLVRLTNSDGSNPQTVIFRYDNNGQIKGYEYGEYTYILEHNEDRKPLRLYIFKNDTQVDGYTWTYRPDGKVSRVSRYNGTEYVCVTDDKGNVTDFYDLADPERSFYTSSFETFTVSKLTVQQYELQQYLLSALNITPAGTLQPVVKNAID